MSNGGASAAAELDSYPQGVGNFVALYQKVQDIKDEVPTKAAQGLRNSAQNAENHAAEIKSAVASLSNAWKGDSATQFMGSVQKFLGANNNVQKALTDQAVSLDKVAAAIKQLHIDVDKLVNDAANAAKLAKDKAAKAVAAAAGDSEEAIKAREAAKVQADKEIADVKTKANAEVQQRIQAAETELSTMLNGLTVDLDQDGFTGIPALGPSGTTPSSISPVMALSGAAPSVGHGGGAASSSGGGGGGSSHGGGHIPAGIGLGPSGGPPASAPPGNVDQWIREAIKILQANGIPVTDADISKIWTIIQKESGGNPNAINNWDCVPLETQILTRQGWLKHRDVHIGHETIGYNPHTQRSEWTRITGVVHYGDAQLIRLGNSRWQATTTPNHRWLNFDPAGSSFITTDELGSDDQLLLAAPAATTPDRATGAGHREDGSYSDAVTQILLMSHEQRAAWLKVTLDTRGTQSPGSVLDAISLAVYLSGSRPRVLYSERANRPETWNQEAVVHPNNPIITGAFLKKEDAGRGDVWCVTTELGSWTAQEGEHIFLTGNSNAAAGHPSKGLMQCIDSTFNAHKLPGHDNIYNPVDSILAGVRYTFSRYGGFDGHPGLKAMAHGGGYQGY